MPSNVLGRTNSVFPPIWLSLSVPQSREDIGSLVDAAKNSGAPIDISSRPALWGGWMRGTDATLATIGNTNYENACDESHATTLVQAHLLETLSSLGREHIDMYFLRVRRTVEEFQLSGALQALELAKQDGHIRFLGICCDGPSLATLGTWQFHDAFELLMVPRNHYDSEPYETLTPMAKERRVGVVTSKPLNWGYGLPFVAMSEHWRLRNLAQSFYDLTLAQSAIADLAQDNPVLVGVKSVKELELALEAPSKTLPEGFRSYIQPYLESFQSEEAWQAMAESENPLEKQAAQRRTRELLL